MNSNKLLVVLIAFVIVAYLLLNIQEFKKNIVIDGYADDWKGIYPVAITNEYSIYKYSDIENLFIMIKPVKDLNNKTFEIKSTQILDGKDDISFYIDSLKNSADQLTIRLNNKTDVRAYITQVLEHEIVYNDIMEMKVPLRMLGIKTGKYFIVIFEGNNINSFKIEV